MTGSAATTHRVLCRSRRPRRRAPHPCAAKSGGLWIGPPPERNRRRDGRAGTSYARQGSHGSVTKRAEPGGGMLGNFADSGRRRLRQVGLFEWELRISDGRACLRFFLLHEISRRLLLALTASSVAAAARSPESSHRLEHSLVRCGARKPNLGIWRSSRGHDGKMSPCITMSRNYTTSRIGLALDQQRRAEHGGSETRRGA